MKGPINKLRNRFIFKDALRTGPNDTLDWHMLQSYLSY